MEHLHKPSSFRFFPLVHFNFLFKFEIQLLVNLHRGVLGPVCLMASRLPLLQIPKLQRKQLLLCSCACVKECMGHCPDSLAAQLSGGGGQGEAYQEKGWYRLHHVQPRESKDQTATESQLQFLVCSVGIRAMHCPLFRAECSGARLVCGFCCFYTVSSVISNICVVLDKCLCRIVEIIQAQTLTVSMCW